MKTTKYGERMINKAINCAVENFIARENRLKDRYIELNPGDADRRNRDAELVIFGATMVKYEIKDEIKRMFRALNETNNFEIK